MSLVASDRTFFDITPTDYYTLEEVAGSFRDCSSLPLPR